jgi:NAD+ diphosphatase
VDVAEPLPPLPYTGLALDRAAGRRADPAWLAEVLAGAGATVLPLWRDRCVVDADGRPVTLPAAAVDGGEPVLLGLWDGGAVFAADLSGEDESRAAALAGGTGTLDLRKIVGALSPTDAALFAYARGLLYWHRNQRYCGACGTATTSRHGGSFRTCDGCGKELFPRIEPAVIVLVEAPGPEPRCLLGRHRRSKTGAFSTLAGFVEIGESLEDAVRREVLEEAGVSIGEVTYQASQAWPFPASLMLGFRAAALSTHIAVDSTELAEARWFTPAEVRARHTPNDSIESHLIATWLATHP